MRSARGGTLRAQGGSLLQLVGLLAILALAAAVVLPIVVRQVDQAARIKEVSNLHTITNALGLPNLGAQAAADQTNLDRALAELTGQPRVSATNTAAKSLNR